MSILRTIALKKLEQLEQDETVAKKLVLRCAFPFIKEQLRYMELLEKCRASKDLIEQLPADFTAIGAMQVGFGAGLFGGVHMDKGLVSSVKSLYGYLYSQQVFFYTLLVKFYAKPIQSVYSLPASSSKNELVGGLEGKRASYAHDIEKAHELQRDAKKLQA